MITIIKYLILLLPAIALGSEDFDLPLKVSWTTEEGVESTVIHTETNFNVSNAINDESLLTSFNLIIYVAVVDDERKYGYVSFYCAIKSVGSNQYISVGESEITRVNLADGGRIDCGHNLYIDLEWVNKQRQPRI